MEEKGKYAVKCKFNGDMHFASSSTVGNIIVKKSTTEGADDKKTSSQNSNSGLSEDGYTYYPEYGPAVDSFGTTRKYAIAHNYHYLLRTVDGQDMGAYVPYDPNNGCYHM